MINIITLNNKFTNDNLPKNLESIKGHLNIIRVNEEKKINHYQYPEMYSLFMLDNDHITAGYINKFIKLEKYIQEAFQPEWTFYYSKSGNTIYQKNNDITHNTNEINQLFFYPHCSRHIIFPSYILRDIGMYTFSEIDKELIPITILKNKTNIIKINNSISIEFIHDSELTDKNDIIKKQNVRDTSLFTKSELLKNQDFNKIKRDNLYDFTFSNSRNNKEEIC